MFFREIIACIFLSKTRNICAQELNALSEQNAGSFGVDVGGTTLSPLFFKSCYH
jgi:hypothetical protein